MPGAGADVAARYGPRPMRTLTYFVAATIDGFIVAEDGSFDFFPFEGALGPTGFALVATRSFDSGVGMSTYTPA
jgi:hypothetical protein